MSEEMNKECPYCGQVNISGEDPRMLCGCILAAKYRKIRSALEAVGGEKSPIGVIDKDLMNTMAEIAHQICVLQVESAVLKLTDGTTVKIGANVVRTEKIELKEKI